jgi:hypothetical protein
MNKHIGSSFDDFVEKERTKMSYPFIKSIFHSSKFYKIEEGVDSIGCDSCNRDATHQTEGSDGELYYACEPCLVEHNLPREGER